MGESLISNGDVVLAANEPPYVASAAADDSGGDIVLRTAGVERARLRSDGTGTGVFGGPRTYDAATQILGTYLGRMLTAADQSLGISVLSDSTANSQRSGANAGDWPYELAAKIALAYPAWTVRWYLWDDASQDYLAPVVVQPGPAGLRSVRFPGTGFAYQLPSGVVASPPTDIDVAVLVNLDNWTPAANQTVFAHDGGAGLRGHWLTVATTGRVQLTWSNDGTTLNTVASSVAPTVANGSWLWIAAKLDCDDGAGNRVIKFFTSPATDGATWTQLGTTTTTGGTTSVFNPPNIPYNLGSRQGGSAELITGNIAEVRFRGGTLGGATTATGVNALNSPALNVASIVQFPSSGIFILGGVSTPYTGASAARTVSDGVLNSTTTITSATAAFVQNDVGKIVTGAGIPANTTIASVTNATTAILSQAASASASGVSLTFNASLFGCGNHAATTGGEAVTGPPGPIILPIFADQWEPVSSTSPAGATGAPVLALLSSAQLGQGLAYLSNSTRLPLLLPDYALKAVFMATSHNESTGNTDSVWLANWVSWITAVKARAYEAAPVITIENPQAAGSSSTVLLRRAHSMRRDKLLSLALQLGLPSLDSWQAFLDTGNPSQYIQTDGVHASVNATFGAVGGPLVAGGSLAGSLLWALYVYAALFGP